MNRLLLTAALCLLSTAARAFPAIVYSVHDGDTVTLLTDAGKITCRTAGDDAPEEEWTGKWDTQPYADQARVALSDMIMGQKVEVEDTGQRSYGRTVCRIKIGNDDVQRDMVYAGYAWSATQFEPENERDPLMPTLQLDAQEHRRGLWSLPNPIAPWQWRHEGMGL
jgi:micrococcal nuclease